MSEQRPPCQTMTTLLPSRPQLHVKAVGGVKAVKVLKYSILGTKHVSQRGLARSGKGQNLKRLEASAVLPSIFPLDAAAEPYWSMP